MLRLNLANTGLDPVRGVPDVTAEIPEAGRDADALEVFVDLGSASQSHHDLLTAEMAWRAVI